MSYFNLIFDQENSWDILNALGQIDLIHIEDQNREVLAS